MPIRTIKMNNVTVLCEGNTEFNYLNGLKKNVSSTINVVPVNNKTGDYTAILKKLKQIPAVGSVARFVLIDYDRFIKNEGERKNFDELLSYCRNENKKGSPTFLIVSNPDFDIFVVSHDNRYHGQDKNIFLTTMYNYKGLEDFKSDVKIFAKFNPTNTEYLATANKAKDSNLIIKNQYNFDKSNYRFSAIKIVYIKENVAYNLSNIKDLFNIL